MPEFRINEEKAMKITHTAGIIDKDTGDELFFELIRSTERGYILGGEVLRISGPEPRSQMTVDARQVFDFLEGSGMT